MTGFGQKVFKGSIWVLLQRFVSQFVGFFVALILARLLTPSDYGTVALLSVFMSIAELLVTAGMGMALVQKKDATDLDFNSLFYASLTVASLCYLVLFFVAPYVADYYSIPDLKWMLRLIAVSLIFSAMNSVQGAEVSRKMLFNLSFKVSLITCFTSATVGVLLAYLGYGPWALAWTGVITGAVGVLSNWFIIAWRPKLMFSFKALKGLFDFGWKVSSVGVIFMLYNNAYAFIIGKFYSKEDLAFVNKGRSIPSLAMNTISSTICGVSFPALAQMQDDRPRLRQAVRRMVLSSTYLVFPMMVGAAICAEDLVVLMYGEKWLSCVPYMRLVCFAFALQPLHDINLQCIAALGRGDVFLRLQLIKTGVGVLFIVIFLRQSVYAFMAASALITGPVSYYINAWHNRDFIRYSFFRQIRDLMPTVLLCALMAAGTLLIGLLFGREMTFVLRLSKVVLQVITGVCVYFGFSILFKSEGMSEYIKVVLPYLRTRSPNRIYMMLDKLMRREMER